MKLAWSSQNLSFFHSGIKSCIETKNSRSAFAYFRQLLQFSVKPTDLTFSLLLKFSASSSLCLKLEAYQIHTHLVKLAFDKFVYVSTSLLDVYMKLGCNFCAQRLFDHMPNRDIVTWNALICGYSKNGYDFDALQLFVQMFREGFIPDETTLVSVVPSCGPRELVFQGKSIHGYGIKTGLDLDVKVKNVLASMYAKCSDLEAAELLFQNMVEDCVVSWNTIIGAYGQNGFFDQAMLALTKMREKNVKVNSVTVLSILSANADPESTHCYVIKTGIINDASVTTSLVCVYAKNRDTESAELLYKSLPEENLVSLTAIISSYAEKGSMSLAVERFTQMQQLDMKVDAVAMVSILHAITNRHHIDIGLCFHAYGLKSGLCNDCLVANGLISMYSKFIDTDAIFYLFSEMNKKPLISWNSVISGCVQAGRASDAMEFYCQMQMSGLRPDTITVASLLSGCSQLGYMQFGRRLHCYVLRNNLEIEDYVVTALIDMYTKCGSIKHAEMVFKSIQNPCVATWNSMISGYSLYGFEQEALNSYSAMRKQGLKPDKITFLGVLAACIHGGLVDEGRKYFKIMKEEFGIAPTLQHSAYMVGLLGRAGFFEEAISFIKTMEIEPDSAVWGSLLSACCMHQEVKLGECLARKLYFLDYGNGGVYVLMSNLYAARGMWDDVVRVRKMMKDIGGDGCSGVSLIEVTSMPKYGH
ncbi:pentatricopeptide repeat-containing protein At2g04860 [Pistacia vera]|uniref:pentatricopeptide repeat-containing protein At2g04860 n=1 Tax=Pistacia vera TaxID=55513 RepID=UPI0012634AAA|nr:pentatricopeptide repeat-containing protein At2g04860 [Pistacia vera]